MKTQVLSLVIIVAYLVLLLAVTLWNRRRSKVRANAEGFFLAGRGVSSVLLPLTTVAASMSTFAFLGAPGMYYSHGISYMVLVLSQIWVAFMIIFFGNKIRKQASKYGYLSIGDYFQDRYNSPYLKILASLISVIMTMVFLAMQYVGNARALSIVTGETVSYEMAILISVVFSLLYVVIGGASGVVAIDAIQAVILTVGVVVAAWIAIGPLGGIKELFTRTAETAPELLSRPGAQGLYTDKYWVMQFIVLPFGIWLCPHFWSKSLMAKDEKALASSASTMPISLIIIYALSALFTGLAAHQLLSPSEVTAADNVLPLLMNKYTNWLVAALVIAAAMSAGMSTINSMLLSTSQIVSQDLILFGRRTQISDRQNMRLSRIIVIVIAVICAVIALRPPETLVQVVQDVAYTGLAQLAPPLIAGLYWKKASKRGAVAGLTAGIVILFATRILNVSPLGWPGFMWAFFTNIILLVVISLVSHNRDLGRVETRFFAVSK